MILILFIWDSVAVIVLVVGVRHPITIIV